MIQHARALTDNAPVQAVVGGLHLRRATPAALRRAQEAVDPQTGCTAVTVPVPEGAMP
ncbi:hypothetical protein P4W15_04600 [Morganella morganii]|nr:hypothetical protein [Morganella morganii]